MRAFGGTILGVLLASFATAAAQSPTTLPSDESTLEQRAGDAAVQELIDHVYELRCASTRKLCTELAVAPEADRAFREKIVADCSRSAGRGIEQGGFEVVASIRTRQLHDALQTLAAGNLLLDKNRLALTPSAGTELSGTGRAWPDADPHDPHPGWRHCGTRRSELAGEAAAADARQNLLLQLAMLRAGESRTVGQVFVSSERFRAGVVERVNALQPEPAVFEPSGLCRRQIALGALQVREMLTAAARSAAAGQEPDANLETVLGAGEDVMVNGYAVAPPWEQVVRTSTRPIPAVRPAWADRVITAKGTARAQAAEPGGRPPTEMAIRAARIEALRQLWLEMEKLPLPSGESLGSMLQHSADKGRLVAAIEKHITAKAKPTPDEDGSMSVTLSIRLEDVWAAIAPPH